MEGIRRVVLQLEVDVGDQQSVSGIVRPGDGGRRTFDGWSELFNGQIFAITAFVALRLAFSTINDSLGAQPDAQLARSLPQEVREAVTYGRPIAT